MPVTTILPKSSVIVRFPPASSSSDPSSSSQTEESYQLLELPQEILKQIQGKDEPYPLTIKGKPSDDAVLCTPTSTFLLRTVSISNSLLICRTPNDTASSSEQGDKATDTLEIRDVSHEILEPIPQAPNLERIRALLRNSAWRGLGEPLHWEENGIGGRGNKRRKLDVEDGGKSRIRYWTREQLESVVQASKAELEKGLRERNVVEVDGRMILLPATKIAPLLSIILTLLTVHGTSTNDSDTSTTVSVKTQPIIQALQDDHDLPPNFTFPILQLFGKTTDEEINSAEVSWEADVSALVRGVGMGLIEASEMRNGKAVDDFERKWREEVGEEWERFVDIKLLEGNYLISQPTGLIHTPQITYFPAHTLPLSPAIRFSDLFLTRSRWRPDEMKPFIKGLVREGDTKEMDKLIAKFVRIVKEGNKGEAWWYPRRAG